MNTASFPLAKDHWLYADHENLPPGPLARTFVREEDKSYRDALVHNVRAAAKYAIRVSTMNGKDRDFDPDAMVRNFLVGMLGYEYHTKVRLSEMSQRTETAKLLEGTNRV